MKSLIAFVLFIVGVSCQTLCINNCAINEEYTICGGIGMCQKNCMTRNLPIKECICEPGCQCKPGFIRDYRFICIPNNKCPVRSLPIGSRICPANEVYSECMAGCQKTCNTLDVAFKCKCVEGCVCNEGYVRSDITNLCVLEERCKSNDSYT